MKKCTLIQLLVPMLLMLAVPALAGPGEVISSDQLDKMPLHNVTDILKTLPQQEVGVHVFYQDAHALIPGGMSTWGGSVIGGGVDYTFRPNVNSGFYVRGMGGYGFASDKLEDSGVGGFTDKVTLKAIYGGASAGLLVPITESAAVYGQGGLFYSTTKGTFDNGTASVDGEAFKVFGLDTALGLRWKIGGKNSMFIEQYSQYGWGSGKDNGVKLNETVKYGCFRGGLRFGF